MTILKIKTGSPHHPFIYHCVEKELEYYPNLRKFRKVFGYFNYIIRHEEVIPITKYELLKYSEIFRKMV